MEYRHVSTPGLSSTWFSLCYHPSNGLLYRDWWVSFRQLPSCLSCTAFFFFFFFFFSFFSNCSSLSHLALRRTCFCFEVLKSVSILNQRLAAHRSPNELVNIITNKPSIFCGRLHRLANYHLEHIQKG